MKITLLMTGAAAERAQWQTALSSSCPGVQWVTHCTAGDEVDVALVANPPPGALQGLGGQRGLRLIQSLWAGVDRLLADPALPAGVPIARMVDPAMSAAMAETALWATLALHRGFFAYAERQRAALWRLHAQRRADEVPVLVLGMGEMGRCVAERLAGQGYRVTGWRLRNPGDAAPPAPAAVRVVMGRDGLHQCLPTTQVLINLLPLTPATEGLLDARLFSMLARGAAVVNLARGAHVVDADLVAALDAGQLGHAVLDGFHAEPLPAAHPFWAHPQVTVLPHAAAQTDPRSAADVVAANLQRLSRGAPLLHLVDRQRGY